MTLWLTCIVAFLMLNEAGPFNGQNRLFRALSYLSYGTWYCTPRERPFPALRRLKLLDRLQ